MQTVFPHAQRLITNFMSDCLADNRDAHENGDSDNEKENVKLSGQVDVADVHRIINTEPAKHKDETNIQRKVCEAPESAMESTHVDITARISGECKVAFQNHLTAIT